MTWWSILKKPQLSLGEKDYTKFRESQALDTLNRILVKDPANNLEAVNRVGFRKKGIRGGKSKRPFVEMMTDKPLKPETLKELREKGFYVTGRKDKNDETGEDSMGYYIRAESFSVTRNIDPTDKERELLTTRQTNPEMERRDRKLEEVRDSKRKERQANKKRLEAERKKSEERRASMDEQLNTVSDAQRKVARRGIPRYQAEKNKEVKPRTGINLNQFRQNRRNKK